MAKPVSVIYICGSGHSGSTLLELLLGAQPGIASFGEVPQGMSRQERDRVTICTCGARPADCPVWSEVLARLRRKGLAPRQRGALRLAVCRLTGRTWSRAGLQLRETYRALREISGAAFLVDSGKSDGTLRRIVRDPALDVRALYLVRDGRAVAFSNARKGRDLMASGSAWAEANARILDLLEACGRREAIRVRYEDLVTDPEGTLACILGALGRPAGPVELDWKLRASHGLHGNRMRLEEGAEIVADSAYVEAVGDADWAALTESMGSMLERFGYPRTKEAAAALLLRRPSARAPGPAPDRPVRSSARSRAR